MTRPRVVFAGTPDFSVPTLDALNRADADIVAVYCQPDRPAGRGRTRRPCAVKRRAETLGLPVRQPLSLKDPDAAGDLLALAPDLMVVAAYGLLLPAALLAVPRRGCVNVHASLLPRWRGAAPIQRAIEAGDEVTGITLMQMDAGLDTGPMLARAEVSIEARDTGGSLHDRLSVLGAELLVRHLSELLAGRLTPVRQDDTLATYARKIERADAMLDFGKEVAVLERRIRAFNPWPICWTRLGEMELRIHDATMAAEEEVAGVPGTVLASSRTGVDVACGRGVLRVLTLQRPGGRPLPAADFLNGTPIPVATVLGGD